MEAKTDQEISSNQYVNEMNILIEYAKNNIEYLEKEIDIKQRMLQANKDSLIHETQSLSKYLNKVK